MDHIKLGFLCQNGLISLTCYAHSKDQCIHLVQNHKLIGLWSFYGSQLEIKNCIRFKMWSIWIKELMINGKGTLLTNEDSWDGLVLTIVLFIYILYMTHISFYAYIYVVYAFSSPTDQSKGQKHYFLPFFFVITQRMMVTINIISRFCKVGISFYDIFQLLKLTKNNSV